MNRNPAIVLKAVIQELSFGLSLSIFKILLIRAIPVGGIETMRKWGGGDGDQGAEYSEIEPQAAEGSVPPPITGGSPANLWWSNDAVFSRHDIDIITATRQLLPLSFSHLSTILAVEYVTSGYVTQQCAPVRKAASLDSDTACWGWSGNWKAKLPNGENVNIFFRNNLRPSLTSSVQPVLIIKHSWIL